MDWNGDDFLGMLQILAMDQLETYERMQSDPFHQPARRTWIRTFCSQVEAFAYGTKQLLVKFSIFPWIRLSPYDVSLLREESYEITTGGDVKVKPDRFVRIETNLKFIAKTAARALDIDFQLDTKSEGWEALLATFVIRNRLVHPKVASDLIVRDEEIVTVGRAQEWFQTSHVSLWNAINAGLTGRTEAAKNDRG